MVSTEYSEAISEVLDILHNSDDSIVKRIPKKLIEFWEDNKSSTYVPNLDHSRTIDEMNLKKKTKDIITMIYLEYLCDSDKKKEIKEILIKNEEKYQKEIRNKYNPDSIFKEKGNKDLDIGEKTSTNDFKLIAYKEPFYIRVINYLKKLFHRN